MFNELNKKVGDNIMMDIKEFRKRTGLNQRAFADYFGVPLRSLQEWEQERKSPPEYVFAMMERIWKLEHPET